ncbi:MAG: hypothetical protein OT477_16065 [Chloroflexi bacterium]|nr:hypothetical protein [Chloroflexota bacterium]
MKQTISNDRDLIACPACGSQNELDIDTKIHHSEWLVGVESDQICWKCQSRFLLKVVWVATQLLESKEAAT